MKAFLQVLGGLIIAVRVAGAAPPTDEELAALYAQPSPFESVARGLWIAESENAYVIRDHKPQAPVHLLVIPKKVIPTLLQAPPELLGEMLDLARKAAEQEGIARSGFRIVINTHPQGSQSVYHLHMHVLGGRQMKWPPG
ncbi:MAG: HIT domain-containing protein [Steroidobacteraceae bacterium]